MSETDWTFLSDGLAIGALDRGITTGIAPPTGGGSFVFGFNSLVTTQGAAGLFTNQAGFAPTGALKGGSMRGAIKRMPSAGDTNFSPFFFMQCQGVSVNDHAYLLGLSDDEPSRIVLAKRSIVSGLPAAPVVGQSGVLALSTNTFLKDTWQHLRLDCIVNTNGDVLLQVFQSVLGDVTAPSWAAVAGLSNFVDDQLGVNSANAGVTAGFEQPSTSGRMGIAFSTSGISRRAAFDHVEAFVQN